MWSNNKSIKNNLTKINLHLKYKKSLYFYNITIYIPFLWKTYMLKSNNYLLLLLSEHYYFILSFKNFFLLVLNHPFINFYYWFNNNFNKLFFFIIKKILYSFSKIFFFKIKFKGKGYRIFKNKNNILKYKFGHYHLIIHYIYYLSLNFKKKLSFFIFSNNFWLLFQTANQIIKWRKINIYTQRGIRFQKTIIFKKTGKISIY